LALLLELLFAFGPYALARGVVARERVVVLALVLLFAFALGLAALRVLPFARGRRCAVAGSTQSVINKNMLLKQ
jgi:hypothetical protein